MKRTVSTYELDTIKIRVFSEDYDLYWPIHRVTISHGWRGGVVIQKPQLLRLIRALFKALERIEEEESEVDASRACPHTA